MDNKIKHLEMIQGVINRMAGNLFVLKGWGVTLIVALLALVAKESEGIYVLIAFCPLIIFWILDGYFLSMERCYRALYNNVIAKREEEIDFSMNISKFAKEQKNTWLKSMFSKTLFIFYGTLIILLIIISLIVNISTFQLDFKIIWQEKFFSASTLSEITGEQAK